MKAMACYIRVSEFGPNQAKQRREINRWLKENRIKPTSVRWYIDKSTGGKVEQPNLEKLQADISSGEIDAVVTWRFDRLAPSMRDGLQALGNWCDKSLRIVSVSQEIDFRGAAAKRIGSVLFAVAEMALETRRERTKAGLASARARGRAGGRPTVHADGAKVILAKELQQDHSLSIDDICKRLKISRSTYYRYVGL
jgi:DNA invertase Pin-like site-specific DNA recombinase